MFWCRHSRERCRSKKRINGHCWERERERKKRCPPPLLPAELARNKIWEKTMRAWVLTFIVSMPACVFCKFISTCWIREKKFAQLEALQRAALPMCVSYIIQTFPLPHVQPVIRSTRHDKPHFFLPVSYGKRIFSPRLTWSPVVIIVSLPISHRGYIRWYLARRRVMQRRHFTQDRRWREEEEE